MGPIVKFEPKVTVTREVWVGNDNDAASPLREG
jgi:hypothetical protein